MNKLIILFFVISNSVFSCDIIFKASSPEKCIRKSHSSGWAKVIIDSDINAESYLKIINNAYYHGIFNIVVNKKDRSINFPLTTLSDDSVVSVESEKINTKKAPDNIYYLSISDIESKTNGKYTRVLWGINDLRQNKQDEDILYLSKKINESKNSNVGLIFILDKKTSMSCVFDFVYEIQKKSNKNIIGITFGVMR